MRAACDALALGELPPEAHISWAIPGSFLTLELWDDATRDRPATAVWSPANARPATYAHCRTPCAAWCVVPLARRFRRCGGTSRRGIGDQCRHRITRLRLRDAGELLAWQGREPTCAPSPARLQTCPALQYAGYDDLIGYAMVDPGTEPRAVRGRAVWALPLFSDDAAPIANSSLPDLIEAAVRAGDRVTAGPRSPGCKSRHCRRDSLGAGRSRPQPGADRLGTMTRRSSTEEAIILLGRTLQRTELARTHLLSASGSGGDTDPATRHRQLRPPTTCSTVFGARSSPSVRGRSCRRPAVGCGDARSKATRR